MFERELGQVGLWLAGLEDGAFPLIQPTKIKGGLAMLLVALSF